MTDKEKAELLKEAIRRTLPFLKVRMSNYGNLYAKEIERDIKRLEQALQQGE